MLKKRNWTDDDDKLIVDQFMDGKKYKQIADLFDVGVNEIRWRLARYRWLNNGYPISRYERRKRIASIEDVKNIIIDEYSITHNDLLGASRKKEIMEPRQIAMALSYKLTGMSTTVIGMKFDGRDHTTVLHAMKVAPKKYPEKIAKIEKIILEKATIAA